MDRKYKIIIRNTTQEYIEIISGEIKAVLDKYRRAGVDLWDACFDD